MAKYQEISKKKITFGEYKGNTYEQLLIKNKSYVQWILKNDTYLSQDFKQDMKFLMQYNELKELSNIKFTFGKNNGHTFQQVYKSEPSYLQWIINKKDWTNKQFQQKIKKFYQLKTYVFHRSNIQEFYKQEPKKPQNVVNTQILIQVSQSQQQINNSRKSQKQLLEIIKNLKKQLDQKNYLINQINKKLDERQKQIIELKTQMLQIKQQNFKSKFKEAQSEKLRKKIENIQLTYNKTIKQKELHIDILFEEIKRIKLPQKKSFSQSNQIDLLRQVILRDLTQKQDLLKKLKQYQQKIQQLFQQNQRLWQKIDEKNNISQAQYEQILKIGQGITQIKLEQSSIS